jgi:prepilin-type processing-associated H-X9-DG protein
MKCPACAAAIDGSEEICPSCQGQVGVIEARGSQRASGAEHNVQSMSWLGRLALEGGACLALLALLVALLMPKGGPREAAWRKQCRSNLSRIAQAMRNYHDTYGSFPPAVTYSADGKPMHSWRVLLLPFLGEGGLSARYNRNEPWNSPANSQLLSQMPKVYACPSAPPSVGETHYAVPVGPQTMFPLDRAVAIREVTDEISHTILVLETLGSNLNWMAPLDVPVGSGTSEAPPGSFSSRHTGGFHVALADGSVRVVMHSEFPPQKLDSLLTRDGGEVIDLPDHWR